MGIILPFSAAVAEEGATRRFDTILRVEIVRRIPSVRLRLTVGSNVPDIAWMMGLTVIVRQRNERQVCGRVTQVSDGDLDRIFVTLGEGSLRIASDDSAHLPAEGSIALIFSGFSRHYPLAVP